MRATNTPATVSELERVIEVMKPYISECNFLESLHPAGRLVRRKSHNGGLYRVSRTQPFIVILHRNLAFFQTLCGAVR